jgi:hypothetical protein
LNETRWFIDMLDGTTGSGNSDPEMHSRPGRELDPNSGIPAPGCEATPGSVYDGVRDSGLPGPDTVYYEPDTSAGSAGPGRPPQAPGPQRHPPHGAPAP